MVSWNTNIKRVRASWGNGSMAARPTTNLRVGGSSPHHAKHRVIMMTMSPSNCYSKRDNYIKPRPHILADVTKANIMITSPGGGGVT